MKPISALKYTHLTMLAKPVSDRAIYKTIRKHKYRSIVEVGLEDGTRCGNMIRVSQKYGASTNIRYTGIDQFDARNESQSPLQLIQMHRTLKTFNAKSQLVPGDIHAAISRIANSHVRTDLIVISAGYDAESLEKSWFYFPRMLHSASLVMIQRRPQAKFESLNRLQIEKLANPPATGQSKAA